MNKKQAGQRGYGPGRRRASFREPGTQSRRSTLLLFLVIALVIIGSGLLVLLVRSLGGDEPAPGAMMPAGAAVARPPQDAIGPIETLETDALGAATGGGAAGMAFVNQNSSIDSTKSDADGAVPQSMLRQENWAGLLRVARSASEPAAETRGYLESVSYRDLTGDGKEEALVEVRMPGSGQYLSYYIYAAAGTGPVMLFQQNNLAHGSVTADPAPGKIVETVSVYGPDDPNCCPSQLRQTTWTWSAGLFVQSSVQLGPA